MPGCVPPRIRLPARCVCSQPPTEEKSSMGARTGAQFLAGLRKTQREIWVDGERIEDVTTHPKLRGGAESLAAIFDRQHDYASDCQFTHPPTAHPTNASHMM